MLPVRLIPPLMDLQLTPSSLGPLTPGSDGKLGLLFSFFSLFFLLSGFFLTSIASLISLAKSKSKPCWAAQWGHGEQAEAAVS